MGNIFSGIGESIHFQFYDSFNKPITKIRLFDKTTTNH